MEKMEARMGPIWGMGMDMDREDIFKINIFY